MQSTSLSGEEGVAELRLGFCFFCKGNNKQGQTALEGLCFARATTSTASPSCFRRDTPKAFRLVLCNGNNKQRQTALEGLCFARATTSTASPFCFRRDTPKAFRLVLLLQSQQQARRLYQSASPSRRLYQSASPSSCYRLLLQGQTRASFAMKRRSP